MVKHNTYIFLTVPSETTNTCPSFTSGPHAILVAGDLCIVPYCSHSAFTAVAVRLGIPILAEDHEWMEAVGSRKILHRHVTDAMTPSVIENIAALIAESDAAKAAKAAAALAVELTTGDDAETVADGVTPPTTSSPVPPPAPFLVPNGFVCGNIRELVMSWRNLATSAALIIPTETTEPLEFATRVTSFEEVSAQQHPHYPGHGVCLGQGRPR